ncbi:MAG TPA: tripartite tricarboxylate transporter permease [Candidatus Methylomirabilis sp.]|nr:tripartite tricarboxylate transporter permease [Candidatus Methylomirabilis sp.]
MENFLTGILSALTGQNLLYAFGGCLIGTLVGVLPGIGPVSAVAILFPFTTYLPPTGMIIALAAIYYGAMYGGSTTAILMNVPGEISAVVTALDGYEMTKKGRPGPALAIAAIVSFFAGIVGSSLIALLGPSVARLALSFGPAEYLGLGLFSLTAVTGLSGKSPVRGVIVTLVGLLLTSVGYDESADFGRLTFGSTNLLLGFDIVPVMIGLFGIGEMLRLYEEKTGHFAAYTLGKLMPSRQELKDGMAAGVRATAIAFPLGLLPGMLPSVTSFLSYSFEKQRSKTPEKFGKGAIEGVAAPEAANNAAAMANLLPLLTLGIPTGPTMALILAALTIYGLIPGPLLFTQHAQFTWTVIGSFFVANVILVILNLPLVGLWARLATIPQPILAPVVIVLCLVGSFSIRSSMFDVWVCVLFGLLGWAATKAGWPLAPLVLAYVLGPLIERSARQVFALSPALLLHRPIFWGFMAMGSLTIWFTRRLWRAAA